MFWRLTYTYYIKFFDFKIVITFFSNQIRYKNIILQIFIHITLLYKIEITVCDSIRHLNRGVKMNVYSLKPYSTPRVVV